MWLFTPEGFYSVVTAEEFGEELQVRARSEGDLERLRTSVFPELGPTLAIPHRDYPCRAFTTRKALAECLVRVAHALDYPNFKDVVAARHSPERAHIYAAVWSDCRKIKNEAVAAPPAAARAVVSGELVDRSAEYRVRDLDQGIWPAAPKARYGGVVFNQADEVLLREPANHFDGYVWSFPKGKPDKGETPLAAALREVFEETGCRPEVVGHLPEAFGGTGTGSSNYYFLMFERSDVIDQSAVAANAETAAVRWATQEDARQLISMTTNTAGRKRDLETLAAAFAAWRDLSSESD